MAKKKKPEHKILNTFEVEKTLVVSTAHIPEEDFLKAEKQAQNDRSKVFNGYPELERSKLITYRWWREDGEIKPEHIPALEEHADERIAEMLKEDYTSGELNTNIRMTDDDPEDGVEYRGWWELTTTTT